MSHPFQALHPNQFTRAFLPLLAATLLLMVVMNVVAAPLENDAAPLGIISFELAGSQSAASEILNSWDANARIRAGFSLGVDYLFMVLYSTTIALGCVWAGGALGERGWPLASFGLALGWGQWLAALSDAVENLGLTLILFGVAGSPWAVIARWCAILKFGLVFVGMAYFFLGLIVHLAIKSRH